MKALEPFISVSDRPSKNNFPDPLGKGVDRKEN
jgi:hypothetical protein